MKIHFLASRPTPEQLADMTEALGYIKVAVDIKRDCLAGGGVMHADCEEVVLREGGKQGDIWGADWYADEKRVAFHSLINLKPRINHFDMEIQDPEVRARVESIVRKIFE